MEKQKVLIVEDAKLIRDRLTSALAHINDQIEIHTAIRLSEAVACYTNVHPHIIILDLSLPDGSGIRFLENVKKETPGTIVIILTNFPFPQVKKKCKLLGADYFFSKENEFDEVINIVESIIHINPAKSELHLEI